MVQGRVLLKETQFRGRRDEEIEPNDIAVLTEDEFTRLVTDTRPDGGVGTAPGLGHLTSLGLNPGWVSDR